MQLLSTNSHYKHFKKANVLTFDERENAKSGGKWLKEIERDFAVLEVPMKVRGKVVIPS